MNNPTEKDFALAEQSITDLTATCRKQEEEIVRLLGLLHSVVYTIPLDVLRMQAGNGFLDMEACDNLFADIRAELQESKP